MIILLKKNRLIRHILVAKTGVTKFDRVKLPASAGIITGVKAYARLITLTTNDPTVIGLTYYYGKLAAPTITGPQVLALTKGTYTDLQPQFTVNSGKGEYIYYAHPASLSDPIFQYGGYQGGFLDQGTINLNTSDGVVPHRIWRSTNPNLGDNVAIQAIH